ncbi:transporter substrate-binding domain-containing protein [Photobacterium makurazakiensis]|uniref:transporter substrate-binding domain-containing protein n=1 Tax=Photobacterium makurazakiensis TaxID=2910234 RepID=UPI003D0D7CC1
MNVFKTVIKSVLVASLLLTTQIANASQLESIQESGVLKVAVPQDFPPFGSVDINLNPQGYDIDMAEYLAKQMNVKLELVPVTSANRIPYLQTRKVDLVISSLGKNAERERAIDFTNAYAPFFLGVFGSDAEKVSTPEELAGKTVGVTRGSVEDIELSKLAPKSTKLKRYEDNNATLSAYLSGQVGLIATGNLVVTEIANRNPNKAPQVKFMLKDSPCFIGIKKGDTALLNEINTLILKAKDEGALEGTSQKWLKAPFPASLGA